MIYAQKAIDDGQGNRVINEKDLSPDEFDKQLKFPLFRAEIEPDLRFFGFDLTIEKARGKVDSNDFKNDKLGWFFVIQEVPGEPRFGMDIQYEPTVGAGSTVEKDTWNNLAWDLFGGTAQPAFVKVSPPPDFRNKGNSDLTDHVWGRHAADLAYELFQTPVMVAVHANDMLDKTQQ